MMELDLSRHGHLTIMAIIAPAVSEETSLWVCVCALVHFLCGCISKCAHKTLEYNEKGEDAGDGQSFNELIEE